MNAQLVAYAHVLYCIAILTTVLPFYLRNAVHYTSPKCPLCERRPAHYATCTLEDGLFIVHRLKESVSMRRAKRTAARRVEGIVTRIGNLFSVHICKIYCQKHIRIMFKMLVLQFMAFQGGVYSPRDALLCPISSFILVKQLNVYEELRISFVWALLFGSFNYGLTWISCIWNEYSSSYSMHFSWVCHHPKGRYR